MNVEGTEDFRFSRNICSCWRPQHDDPTASPLLIIELSLLLERHAQAIRDSCKQVKLMINSKYITVSEFLDI
jgi:hypothetical protein